MATLFLGLAIGGFLVRRTPTDTIGLGLAIASAGFLMIAFAGREHALAILVVGSSVMTMGVGMVVLLATDIIMATAPPERAGSSAGLAETSNEFGGALGVAVLGSAIAAMYHLELADQVPAGVSDEQQEALLGTIAGAVDTARGLPSPLGPALIEAASDSFTDGVQLAALKGAAILAVVAVLAVGLLRELPSVGQDEAGVSSSDPPTDRSDPPTDRWASSFSSSR